MYLHRMFGAAPLPADVNGDRYRIKIYDDLASLKRTIEFDSDGGEKDYFYNYTFGRQVSDGFGFAGDDAVHIKIYHRAFANPNYGDSAPVETVSIQF